MSYTEMTPTVANAQGVIAKARTSIATIKTFTLPNGANTAFNTLLTQLNTLLICADPLTSQATGTFGGSAGGDFDPPSGGTPCGA